MTKHSKVPIQDLTIDEAARPSVPPIPDVTDKQRRAGLHLAAIHRMHLREMSKGRMVLRHIIEGEEDPSALIDALQGMEMVQNMRLFGNLCGQECRVLTFHHDAEEHHIFPILEAQPLDGLRAVVAQLRKEHEVVHELLNRLEAAAHNLVNDPTEANFQTAAEIFDRLDTVVRSHFGYEETELRDALGVFVPVI